jgi:small nuclear ribonucleoprotein (snRNP)-like protein
MNIIKNEIIILKLTSGEELIAKVINDELMQLTVKNPISVATTTQGIGLIPCLFTANEELDVIINKNNIIMYASPREEIKNKYIEMTSGITVPNKKIILG